MKSERSILIQKKTILILSLIMTILFSLIVWREKNPAVSMKNQMVAKEEMREETEESRTEKSFLEQVKIRYLTAKTTEKSIEIDEAVFQKQVDHATYLVDEAFRAPIQGDIAFPQEEKDSRFSYQKVVEVTATAYCLCQKCCGKTPDHPDYGYTATGLKIVPGTGMKVIAVDPTVIPLKSHVYVEGLNGAWDYGYAIAADTGGAIKNQKIDLYMDSHADALKWGRRTVKVYVLD